MASDKIVRVPIAALGVAGFVIGLVVSYWVAGLFGFSPAIMWSVLVILFVVGVFFLDHPKLFLYLIFVYHATSFNGTFFGRWHFNIPFIGILDEALLAVPIAILIMKAIHRQLPRGATWFPVIYLFLAVLSWRINHVPTMNFVRVTLSYSKFYIFWFFARAIGPWSIREKRAWLIILVVLAFVQFPMNCLWQGGLTVSIHADNSVGTIGGAHLIGYISTFALFMIAGWMLSLKAPLPGRRVALAAALSVMIAYDLIFLTDTKHVLLMVPLAALPFFFFPRFPTRSRALMIAAMGLFVLFSGIYLSQATRNWGGRVSMVYQSMKYSGKGAVFRAITGTLREEVPAFGLLGAGPGNFCSTVGTYSMRPLANKYVLPYLIRSFRSGGTATESSIVGGPMSSLYTLWGEFGPFTTLAYFWFWFFALRHLWRESLRTPGFPFETGQRLAVTGCVIVVFLVGMLSETFNIGILMLPLWSLVGIYWDGGGRAEREADEPPPEGMNYRMPFRF
mgnify:CR=1 FL=1